jgi:serine phosphatase RsbU (regulator of sigma subunit)
VITRNNPAPVLVAMDEEIRRLDDPCKPIGLYRGTRPTITEVALQVGLTVVMFTDGIVHAGKRSSEPMDASTCLRAMLEDSDPAPQEISDSLLTQALKLDQGRPSDDITVVALRVLESEGDSIRRMSVRLPLDV